MRVWTIVGPLLLLALAGCGTTGDGDGVATAGGAASSSAAAPAGGSEQDAALEFSRCMRENGVPDFPDPEIADNGEMRLSLPEGANPEEVDAAQAKCKQFLPNGGKPKQLDPELIAKQREYSQCMRDNGVPKFPDPNPEGGISIQGGPGLDPMSPEFKAAEEKCRVHLPDGGAGASTDSKEGA